MPHGIDSWSYVAIGGDGGRAFVKIARRDGAAGATQARARPAAPRRARGRRPRPRRPAVADRDGGYLTEFDGFWVQVLEYLEGRTLADETAWPEALYAKVADTVAAVHASTEQVRHLVTRTERYELPFVPAFVALVRDIADRATVRGPARTRRSPRCATWSSPGRARSRRPSLASRRCATTPGRGVARRCLCHTDIWGSNLILSPDGTLHLVDWDGALIGPPEADLFMFAGTGFFPAERFGEFLERYEAAFRPTRLDADVLAFYLYRRNLEDLADFVDAVATGRSDAMAPVDSLRLVGELLAEQARLEDRIAASPPAPRAPSSTLNRRPCPRPAYGRVTHGPLDFRAIGGRAGPATLGTQGP